MISRAMDSSILCELHIQTISLLGDTSTSELKQQT